MIITGISIAGGAVVGALLRWGLLSVLTVTSFPLATFVANCLGCFILGVTWGLSLKITMPESVRLGVMVGGCGSLTTFSTIMMDLYKKLAVHDTVGAMGYFILTNVAGAICLGAGILCSKCFVPGNH